MTRAVQQLESEFAAALSKFTRTAAADTEGVRELVNVAKRVGQALLMACGEYAKAIGVFESTVAAIREWEKGHTEAHPAVMAWIMGGLLNDIGATSYHEARRVAGAIENVPESVPLSTIRVSGEQQATVRRLIETASNRYREAADIFKACIPPDGREPPAPEGVMTFREMYATQLTRLGQALGTADHLRYESIAVFDESIREWEKFGNAEEAAKVKVMRSQTLRVIGGAGIGGGPGSDDVQRAEQQQKRCSLPGCKASGVSRCSRCKTALYCSREHQRQHWKVHKKGCSAAT